MMNRVFVLVVTGAAGALLAANPADGLWNATVVVNGVETPFRFEIGTKRGEPTGAFFNGDERVRSTRGTASGAELTLYFDHYATKLTAKLENGRLVGRCGRDKRVYPFQAERFTPPAESSVPAPSIAGAWEIGVKSPKGESAWRLLVRQQGAEVSASILRIDGDTGTLSGRFRDGRFVLSHFSGARPNVLEITPGADGTLEVVQNGKNRYKAVRATEARAQGLPEPADPSRWTSVQDPSQPLRFRGTDLTGKVVDEADPRFRGKVVLVNITGSWCPNCHDEAPFLAELYRKYRKQGLEIVALSFEEEDQLQDPARLRAFIKTYGLEYTVLLGGEPGQLKEKLPQAVNLNTWPATFFVGRDGLVRGAHAGFASAATGDLHCELKAEFARTVEKLLGDNVRSAR